MSKQVDVKKVIEENPQVDQGQLNKVMDELKNLRQTGVIKPSEYSLEPPDKRRQSQACDSSHLERGVIIRF